MAGKGDKWRKGTDYSKYRESTYWNPVKKEKEPTKEKKEHDGNRTREDEDPGS